jgi:hypothetical protein
MKRMVWPPPPLKRMVWPGNAFKYAHFQAGVRNCQIIPQVLRVSAFHCFVKLNPQVVFWHRPHPDYNLFRLPVSLMWSKFGFDIVSQLADTEQQQSSQLESMGARGCIQPALKWKEYLILISTRSPLGTLISSRPLSKLLETPCPAHFTALPWWKEVRRGE